jgi:multisubunit Na+/H+ antiporter MnhG subunit
VSNVAVDVLLALGVAGEAVCVLGVVVMRDTFDRLHYLGASTTVPAFCFLAAVLIREHVSAGGLEATAAVALLFLFFPVSLLAITRAARRIDFGDESPRLGEKIDA